MVRSQRLGVPSLSRWDLDSTQTAILLGIVVVTAILYLPSLRNGFVYDDSAEILQNRLIGHWSFIWRSFMHDSWWFRLPGASSTSPYYRPMQNMWLGLMFHVFGKNPIGWHAVKILMHLGVVVLCFRVVQLLSGDFNAAALTAALFGIHPVHAEAITWIAAVPEVLTALFTFSAFVLFVERGRGSLTYLASVALFAFALFSHESAVMFPLVFAADSLLFRQTARDDAASGDRIKSALAAMRECWPFFALEAVLMLIRVAVLHGGFLGILHTRPVATLVSRHIVINKNVTSRTPMTVVETLPVVIVKDLGLLMFPWQAGPAHELKFLVSPFAFES